MHNDKLKNEGVLQQRQYQQVINQLTQDNEHKAEKHNQIVKENRRLEESIQELSSLNQSTNMELNEKKLLKKDLERAE